MSRDKNDAKTTEKSLDTVSQKSVRGPKWTVVPSAVWAQAKHNRGILAHVWHDLWPLLEEPEGEADVVKAFQIATPGGPEFPRQATLIFKVLQDPMFPKRERSRIDFLADSIAGQGIVTPRRSRDICAQERKKEKHTYHILRCEFYVECSCGYRGPSRDKACRKCNAQIPEEWFDG
jgi:hypothetical protein